MAVGTTSGLREIVNDISVIDGILVGVFPAGRPHHMVIRDAPPTNCLSRSP